MTSRKSTSIFSSLNATFSKRKDFGKVIQHLGNTFEVLNIYQYFNFILQESYQKQQQNDDMVNWCKIEVRNATLLF